MVSMFEPPPPNRPRPGPPPSPSLNWTFTIPSVSSTFEILHLTMVFNRSPSSTFTAFAPPIKYPGNSLLLNHFSIKGSRSVLNCCWTVSYTHLRAHETRHDLVCRLLLEKK